MADPQNGTVPGIDEIATALSDRGADVRDRILEALGGFDQPAPRLITIAICDPEPEIRAGAVVAVARLMRPVDVVPLLIAICHDSDGESRGRAGWALGKLGSDAAEAIDTLIRQAETDGTIDARYGAMWALARIGPAALETEAQVRRCLTGERDGSFRAVAAAALGAMGAVSEDSHQALVEAVENEDPLVREEAAAALGRVGIGPKATGALIGALGDPASLVREAAAVAIGRSGTGTRSEVAALRLALDDPAPHVRRKAADTMELLGRSQSSDDRSADRIEAPPAIAEVSATIEHWLGRLDSESPFSRAEAAWELGILGPRSAPALAALRRQAQEDPGSDARWAACLAIGRTRLAEATNLETLRGVATGDWDPDVRSAAVEALGGLGFASNQVLEPITAALRDEDSLVREQACSALERIGRATPEAVQCLERAAEDSHPSVRAKAKSAIAIIRRLASA